MSDTVCIIGLAPSSRDLALEEPPGVEMWSLNQGHAFLSSELMARMTRWFQVHPYEEMEARQNPELQHLEWLKEARIPVYLEEVHPEVPMSVRYPYEQVCLDLNGVYLTSAIAFMLALAIHQKFTLIKLYGVDMASETEYADQRPCVEFLLGRAIERGIQVWLPPGCPLLKGPLYAKTVFVPTSHIQKRMMELINAAHYQKEAYHEVVGQLKLGRELLARYPAWAAGLTSLLETLEHQKAYTLGVYNSIAGSVRLCEELLATALRGDGSADPAELAQAPDGLVYFPKHARLYAKLAPDGTPSTIERFWPENLPPVDGSPRAEYLIQEHNRRVTRDYSPRLKPGASRAEAQAL